MNESKKLAAEAIGTFTLVFAGIGSAVLAAGVPNVGIGFMGIALAVGLSVMAGAYAFGTISGAHFNPAVSGVMAARGAISWREAALFAVAQLAGGLLGAFAVHLMFDLPILQASVKARAGVGQWAGEVVATTGLVLTILGTVRHRAEWIAPAVAAYIVAAYWFTSSTSFANPAVTLARTLSDTFTGIAPASAPGFVLAQLLGGALGLVVVRLLHPGSANAGAGTPVGQEAAR